MRQILVNLLTNGIKFTPAGGRVQVSAGLAETPSPEAMLAARGPWVYVRVEDNGPGVPPERLEAVLSRSNVLRRKRRRTKERGWA